MFQGALLIYVGLFLPCLVAFLLGYGVYRLLFRQRSGNVSVASAFALTWVATGLVAALWPTPIGEGGRWLLFGGSVAISVLALGLSRLFYREHHRRGRSLEPLDTDLAAIEPRAFGLAQTELVTNRNEDLWAKCLALADGNENAAAAMYVRTQARAMPAAMGKAGSDPTTETPRRLWFAIIAIGAAGIVALSMVIGVANDRARERAASADMAARCGDEHAQLTKQYSEVMACIAELSGESAATAPRSKMLFNPLSQQWQAVTEAQYLYLSTPGRTRDEACFGPSYRERLVRYQRMCGTTE